MKGVLFDLDGVIADTSTYHFQAWRKLIKDNFNRNLPDELEKQTKGVSREDSLRIILGYLKIKVSPERFTQLTIEKNKFYQSLLSNLTKKDILPGITQFIADLKFRQIKLSLASASLNGPFILKKLHLSDKFDAIADPGKISAGKPAPDIFIAAAKAIDVPVTDCIGIEDSVAGITAINLSGAFSVGIGKKDDLDAAKLLFSDTAKISYTKINQAWNNWKK
ncbi:beta-phosphoglucomutase [Lactobacillus sp. ESL0791]|uniref:beta-phosphoglucomutase n=1 Tax=Lactobacillus sp. ESL0791 TaxID=2983234 RepID=UPI0023F6B649|nr:beta-phosphoglucomutase [Lactobacillus sp. ESL0791]MDF7638722.1 beta-phosphoglucomutase [Lactobacillus sp. ESL0791]